MLLCLEEGRDTEEEWSGGETVVIHPPAAHQLDLNRLV